MKRNLFFVLILLVTVSTSCFAGVVGGVFGSKLVPLYLGGTQVGGLAQQNVNVIDESSSIINVAQQASDSVVSIVISKDIPVQDFSTYKQLQNLNGDPFSNLLNQDNESSSSSSLSPPTQLQQVGAGSGFIISTDGMIITNRHVVQDTSASYTVILNNGKTYLAKILARDTLLDIAFVKVDATGLKALSLGSSTNIKVGQTVVAIGNALGEFSNTVNKGIISGLKRTITAGDSNGGSTEQLSNVIQSDASINLGNSGGPLLDIQGNVIGVNVAIAQNAQNIGFAIPIDTVKDLLNRYQKFGNIKRPVLGVRIEMINPDLKKQLSLTTDYGALVTKGANVDSSAVISGSIAEKIGIKESDIIQMVNNIKIDQSNPLPAVIQQFNIGDSVNITILRKGSLINLVAKL